MDDRLRQLVRRRAKNFCEYCQMRQDQEPLSFHIEHIIPRRHGGKDVSNNLALACHHCNLRKGTNLSGIDPRSKKITRLYHPRLDDWEDHFIKRDGEIAGRTAVGRTTVNVLRMNEDGRAQLRDSAD
jgi:5-methylcytosine-specific restriction endonuclease McrA